MKKVRVVFSVLAVTIASASVFANTLVVTTFWRSSTTVSSVPGSATPDCAVQITLNECPATTGQICTIPADSEGNLYIVSKKVDSPTCVLARKTPQ